MNNFNELSISDLENIDGGKVSALDVALCLGGFVYPPIGIVGAFKTCSDYLCDK